MLLIYDDLVAHITRILNDNNIQASIDKQIENKWHRYRYIQIVPASWNNVEIHYEYCNGYWELHFEQTYENTETDRVRKINSYSI